MRFSSLINWYNKHKRDLPWRNTHNPYLVWISEIILQQTRVEQGLPYYVRYTEKYTDIKKLAAAPKDEVFKLWQGLGYYNRAENMLNTAQLIVKEYGGKFPQTYDELIQLKGIGPYTAAAIASFAFNEARPVVDGNVYRVLSRVFAIKEPIDSTTGKKLFHALAEDVLNKKYPGTHNQAMMELGATICKPKNPLCNQCPVMQECEARSAGIIEQLPVKSKKSKPKDRYLNYFFIIHKNHTYIYKRGEKNIWKNLYEPPFMESNKLISTDELAIELEKSNLIINPKKNNTTFKLSQTFKHQLTHQTIYANFWVIENVLPSPTLQANYLKVKLSDLHNYPVHRLFDKFLNYIYLAPK